MFKCCLLCHERGVRCCAEVERVMWGLGYLERRDNYPAN